jgi:hypothetical protein
MKNNLFIVAFALFMFANLAHADCENECSIDFTNAIDACCTDAESCQTDDPLHYNECTRAYAHCTQSADRAYAKCLSMCDSQ